MKSAKIDVRLYRERDGKEEEAKRAYPLRDALAALLDLHDPMGAFGAVTIERKDSSLLAYVGPRPQPEDQEEGEDELPKWAAESFEHIFESLLEELPIPKKLDTPPRKKSRWA